MQPAQSNKRSEETAVRILESALDLFRKKGYDAATMRDIASQAGVATGAAYYYYASKEAIVLDFYQHSCLAIQPEIEAAVDRAVGFEARLRAVIEAKLEFFAPNRNVLRALLRNGADPSHPLSPFSSRTKEIRDIDVAWFRRILADSGMRIPKDIGPHLPNVLWFLQMGVIYFWVTAGSSVQPQTDRLIELAAKLAAALIRLSGFPLMRPIRRAVVEMIGIVSRVQ